MWGGESTATHRKVWRAGGEQPYRPGQGLSFLALPGGRTRLISSAVAKKQSFLTTKEPWSQFSSLGQSHKGLILESNLVFIPWMLSPILCGATASLRSGPSAHPRKLSAPSEFSNANSASTGGPAASPVVREASSSPFSSSAS